MTDGNPGAYPQFKEIVLCTNKAIECEHIMRLNDIEPLIVRPGPIAPRIWINAAADPEAKSFREIVGNSVATHPLVSVRISGRRIAVLFKDEKLLEAKQDSPSKCSITFIDFRRLGFVLFGNTKGLTVGGMEMKNNTFVRAKAMFSFGTGSSPGP